MGAPRAVHLDGLSPAPVRFFDRLIYEEFAYKFAQRLIRRTVAAMIDKVLQVVEKIFRRLIPL